MSRDRYLTGLLTVIAILLFANLFKSPDRPLATLESTAVAQTPSERVVQVVGTPVERQAGNLRVSAIGGYNVSSLKEVVSLGDGKTFVVSNPGGFLVYQVEPVNRPDTSNRN